MAYFASKQDALSCDHPAVVEAVTRGHFDEASAKDAIDAIMSMLLHSAIPPDLWATAASDEAAEAAVESERPKQLHLFRDVFANPFRSVSIKGCWLKWNEGTVVKLAQGMYDERAFDRLPILADALEDAGCGDAEILAHCRQPGEHVRGCWCLDLLLGKG